MSAFLAPGFGAGYQSFLNSGAVNAGGHILTYLAGTTTPQATWSDSTQTVSNGTSITLDSAGRPGTPSNVEIWIAAGVAMKFQITDVNNVNVGPAWDYIPGVNDTTTTTITQWITTGGAPTYVSATQFTLAGDQTGSFILGRRIRYTLSSGDKYGSVTGAAYAAGTTTITVLVDVTALDNTLSAVALGATTPGVEGWTAFTPGVTFGGGATGVTYNINRQGEWLRIAGLIFVRIRMVLSNKGSSTGSARITGLPFIGISSGVGADVLNVSATNMTGLTGALKITTTTGSSLLTLSQSSATGDDGAVADTVFTNTSNLYITGWYRAYSV